MVGKWLHFTNVMYKLRESSNLLYNINSSSKVFDAINGSQPSLLCGRFIFAETLQFGDIMVEAQTVKSPI